MHIMSNSFQKFAEDFERHRQMKDKDWVNPTPAAMEELFAEPPFPPARDLKKKGGDHYKTGKTEPLDLIRDGGRLWPFALGNIIKYAFRLRLSQYPEGPKKDLDKIIHYAEILLAELGGPGEDKRISGK